GKQPAPGRHRAAGAGGAGACVGRACRGDREGGVRDPGVAGAARLFPQPEGVLRRPHQAVLEEPAEGADLLAAAVGEAVVRALALLPPTGPGYGLQGAAALRRAEDQGGDEPAEGDEGGAGGGEGGFGPARADADREGGRA